MEQFQRNVQRIEMEANTFIDESFKTLRSAEGAFDMLHNFKHIRSRDAINSTMMKKFNEILTQFEKEVRTLYTVNDKSYTRENFCGFCGFSMDRESFPY